MKKVKFVTLGCKVNQYETQGMREALSGAGMETHLLSHSEEEVDFVVINTCTVTHEADRQNRYWIRRVKRENPNAKIVVTGCAVTRDRAVYENIPEVDLVLANHHKAEIADYLLTGCGSSEGRKNYLDETEERKKRLRYTPLAISHTPGNARAFVKIQDGCNHACSFCKVVLARGRSRSRPIKDILEETKRLRDSGYKEIVFAGIQLGAYGLDFQKGKATALVEVLEACSEIEGIERLRLSSIEPTDITPQLIGALKELKKCCHHLHIPLQSGDDEVLKAMNRRYGRDYYINLIDTLKEKMPDFCLTLDVMAGFPGEEEEHFQNTVELLKKVKPLKCHVFPYSAREGTKAFWLKNVSIEIVRDRVERLIRLGDELAGNVSQRFLGQETMVLIEGKADKVQAVGRSEWEETGCFHLLQGLTPNYLKVFLKGEKEWIGESISVRLLTLQQGAFLAEVISKNSSQKTEITEELLWSK